MKYFTRYSKNYAKCDYEVAHVYEHLVINRILDKFHSESETIYGYGSVDGETFVHGNLNINLGLYDSESFTLATQIIKQSDAIPFTVDEIKAALNQVEIEEQGIADYAMPVVKAELNKIRRLPWKKTALIPRKVSPKTSQNDKKYLIEFEDNPESFRNNVFWLKFDIDSGVDEQWVKIFSLMTQVIQEATENILRREIGCYPLGEERLASEEKSIYVSFTVRTRTEISSKEIKSAIAQLEQLNTAGGYARTKKTLKAYLSNDEYRLAIKNSAPEKLNISYNKGDAEELLTKKNYHDFFEGLSISWGKS